MSAKDKNDPSGWRCGETEENSYLEFLNRQTFLKIYSLLSLHDQVDMAGNFYGILPKKAVMFNDSIGENTKSLQANLTYHGYHLSQ